MDRELIRQQDEEYAASLAVDRRRRLQEEAVASAETRLLARRVARGVRVRFADRQEQLERDTPVGELSALWQAFDVDYVRASVPRSVVVGPTTRQLVGRECTLADLARLLGAHERETIVLSSGEDAYLTLSDLVN